MARKRMISPGIWESESFSELSDFSKLVFISLISHADDEGRGRAKPATVANVTFPNDENRRVADVKKALSEIGLKMSVQFYSVDGREYYAMTNWFEYQKIDKPTKSKLPPPPLTGEGGAIRTTGKFDEDSGRIRVGVGEQSAPNIIEDNIIKDPPCIPPCEKADGTDGTVEGYLEFMRNHPYIQEDLENPSELCGIDFSLLAQKISESARYLKGKSSLKWLIRHYREIVGDSYKDFGRKPAVVSGKGDLQLWQELMRALREAQSESYCAEVGYSYPIYAMRSTEAKEKMSALYKGLAPEITAYFDPNSFLELCKMEEKDLKYERARFLKALPEIRIKLTEERNGVN